MKSRFVLCLKDKSINDKLTILYILLSVWRVAWQDRLIFKLTFEIKNKWADYIYW